MKLRLIASVVLPVAALAHDPERMEETVVVGKRDNILGTAQAATEGTASGDELRARPILRRGEVLETVPGMIVTQHAGGGKANQYFLRGFNLDHGTDFAISLDGMPINMRTHAHDSGRWTSTDQIPKRAVSDGRLDRFGWPPDRHRERERRLPYSEMAGRARMPEPPRPP